MGPLHKLSPLFFLALCLTSFSFWRILIKHPFLLKGSLDLLIFRKPCWSTYHSDFNVKGSVVPRRVGDPWEQGLYLMFVFLVLSPEPGTAQVFHKS